MSPWSFRAHIPASILLFPLIPETRRSNMKRDLPMGDYSKMKKKTQPTSFRDPKELSSFFSGPDVSGPEFGSPEIRRAAEIFLWAADWLKTKLPEEQGMGIGEGKAGEGTLRTLEDILGKMASAGLEIRRAAILEKNGRMGEGASGRALKEAERLMEKIEVFSSELNPLRGNPRT